MAQWIGVKEAAEIIGCPVSSVRKYAWNNYIPSRRDGKYTLYRRDYVEWFSYIFHGRPIPGYVSKEEAAEIYETYPDLISHWVYTGKLKGILFLRKLMYVKIEERCDRCGALLIDGECAARCREENPWYWQKEEAYVSGSAIC